MAYVVCDNCCADLNILLMPGYHVPSKSKNYEKKSLTVSTAMSVQSKVRNSNKTWNHSVLILEGTLLNHK